MRVSEYYSLNGTQATFDFVDVDIYADTPLFIDPSLLGDLEYEWAEDCAASVQDFFQRVLDRILADDAIGARALLGRLGEENATHLGYSSRSRGSGVGSGLADKFFEEIESSHAVKSGLITDLQDTALLIEGINEDRISDVTTNIIRRQLVEYTQTVCEYYGISMLDEVVVGPFWDVQAGAWKQQRVSLPMPNGSPLLLVPKEIVGRVLHYNPDEYYRHYVLEYFKDVELAASSPLVHLIKSGQRRVTKKDVERKYRAKHQEGGPGVLKRVNLDGTRCEPNLLANFKRDKKDSPPRPLGHEEFAEATGVPPPDYDALLGEVLTTSTGQHDAAKYERNVEALFSALFHPSLVHPRRQERIHDGRKILDITYANMADDGFFNWLSQHYPAAHVVVECKNYSKDLGNPEYDQLSGRFSPSRGRYGLLVFRNCSDKERLLLSCKDTSKDDRGFITPLDDEDLKTLVLEAKKGSCVKLGGLLHDRFKALIS